MPAQVTNYQCPACTGPLHFDAASGKLTCEYCASSYSVEEIEALFAEKNAEAVENKARADEKQAQQGDESQWDTSGLSQDWGKDADGVRVYSCPSCCAELICEETTAATSCPYCGNPTVVPGQFSGILKPDYVAPFQKSKEDALAALKKHYEGRPFLPDVFQKGNHLEEIKGVYVPFWLFSGEAEVEGDYECGRSHTFDRGNYVITETEHYSVRRAGTIPFERIPVDASKKVPDDYMDSLEPFDYTALKPFSNAYLPGYLADKYDISAEECSARADERASATAGDSLRDSVSGYSSVAELRREIRLNRGEVKYALLPVWLLTTRWNGQTYLFAMNGQTGKFVGDLPVDKKKKWRKFATIYGISALVTALLMLFPGGLLQLLSM